MELTTQQRAKRRAAKINKRTSKALPLFAGSTAIDQFLTTETDQLQAVRRWDEINERYFKQIEEADIEFASKAKHYQTMLSQLVGTEYLAILDERIEKLIERYSAYKFNPAYVADFWHTELTAISKMDVK